MACYILLLALCLISCGRESSAATSDGILSTTCSVGYLECPCRPMDSCTTKCIPNSAVCDSHVDCGDAVDEHNCSCSTNEVQCPCVKSNTCPLRRGCLKPDYYCEGFFKCPDNPAGETATIPEDYFECACHRNNTCDFTQCIPMESAFATPNVVYDYGLPSMQFEVELCSDDSNKMAKYCPVKAKFLCACFNTTCTDETGCQPLSSVCNGYNDCGDWSDEAKCDVPKSARLCACGKPGGDCETGWWFAPASKLCNGHAECSNLVDERNCSCPENHLPCDCNNGPGCQKHLCYPISEKCNGYRHCDDWTDEKNCSCRADQFECACYRNQSCFNHEGCIASGLVCDGQNRCSDWSDEINCTLPNGTFACDCYHQQSCKFPPLTITEVWFQESVVCDGYISCQDGSDERKNCSCPKSRFQCDCHKTNTCPASSSGCVDPRYLCDESNDCGDWSDEKNCTCAVKQTTCLCLNNNCIRKCIPGYEKAKCDGKNQCGDWSDEFYCRCSDDRFQCSSCEGNCLEQPECIDRSLVCNGKHDCLDGSDESHCNCSDVGLVRCGCVFAQQNCSSTSRCIPQQWIADGVEDCSNGSDEPCETSRIWCDDCPVIVNRCTKFYKASLFPNRTLNYIKSCSTNLERCFENETIISNGICSNSTRSCSELLLCEDGNYISSKFFCDRSDQYSQTCPDKSDEQMQGLGFKCSGISRLGVCILPQVNLYDSEAQCLDASDLCLVNGTFKCFQCLDRKLIISNVQVCDGVADCYDLSDECLCKNQTTCDLILGDSRSTCPVHHMHCHNASDCIPISDVLCNRSVSCQRNVNTKFCTKIEPPKQTGKPPAQTMTSQDLCSMSYSAYDGFNRQFPRGIAMCDGRASTFQNYRFLSNYYGWNCWLFDEKHCPSRFNCKSKDLVSIENQRLCDGIVDCDNGMDENKTRCSEKRFYCPKGESVSIDRKFLCDGIVDCDNGKDEEPSVCTNRFYCYDSEPLSIDKTLVNNGIKDCKDGSDECKTEFSDRYEMIAEPFLRAMFWMMGFLAILGNVLVLYFGVRKLMKKKSSSTSICINMQILSLAVADLMIGVYLIAVVSKGVTFSGSYCRHDKSWRSSSLCQGLGALAIIASEASAMTMTVMTTYRLYSVLKPFEASSIGPERVVGGIVIAWIASVVIGIMPLFNYESGYFVNSVWFPNQFFNTDQVPMADMENLARRVTYNHTDLNWFETLDIIKETFPFNPVKAEFGYYGKTSVCMPQFYSNRQESAWQYSAFLISINLIMFVYMVVGYFLIYKLSTKMSHSRSNDKSRRMQKRISRLIITDFFCWVPICLMGCLSLGGIAIPPNAYVASAGVLLPINSALNPILYSKYIEEKVTRCFCKKGKTADGTGSVSRSLTQTTSTLTTTLKQQDSAKKESSV